MITIARKIYFSCGIQNPETQALYGHNYTLEAFVSGPEDSTSGLVINLTDLKAILQEVVDPIDHCNLSLDHPHFKNRPYSLQEFSEFLFQKIETGVNNQPIENIFLEKIRLSESDDIHIEVLRNDP